MQIETIQAAFLYIAASTINDVVSFYASTLIADACFLRPFNILYNNINGDNKHDDN